MLNFGRYSADNFPNVRVYPALVDRILEIVAVLLTLGTWGVAVAFHFLTPHSGATTSPFVIAGFATLCLIALGWCGYIPIRLVRFPFRITERNVYTQFFLAIRTTRCLNVVLSSLFLIRCLGEFGQKSGVSPELCDALTFAVALIMVLILIIYYLFAYRYR